MLKSLIYGNKWLIGVYSYKELGELDSIRLDKSLNNKQIKYLNFLKKDTNISFYYNDYNNIFKSIQFLIDNKYEDISIQINNKKEFNNYIFNNDISKCFSDNVTIYENVNVTTLEKYMEYEKTLYDIVKPAINLSNYEKYIYVYNIVKMFKEYKECNNDRIVARNLYKILDNEYMVCVGYAKLLSDLLSKLNINNTTIDVTVDVSYKGEKVDKIDFTEVKKVKRAGHERVYVYLKDDKYKIDGYYFSDPTWDNDLELDLYNHMLFTNRKNDYCKNYQWFNDFMLFNIKSLHEFNIYFDFIRDRFNKSGIDLLNYIIDIIKKLEPDYFNVLNKKYKFEEDRMYYIYECDKPSDKILLRLKKELGDHILKRVNNDISELEKWRGIKNIYKMFYGYKGKKTLRKGFREVKYYNEIREDFAFPQRYKVDKYNNKTLVKKI